MSASAIVQALERILMALWVGGLWTTGLVIAPVLFKNYERRLAGDIAGHLFAAVSLISMVCAALLLIFSVLRARRGVWRDWRTAVLLAMLLIALVGEFGVAARMREIKALMTAQAAAAAVITEFGRLHAVASLLFLANSALGLALVVAGVRPRPQPGN